MHIYFRVLLEALWHIALYTIIILFENFKLCRLARTVVITIHMLQRRRKGFCKLSESLT